MHIISGEGDVPSSCNPAVFNFYNYLRTHPLLLRRHFGSSDTSSTHICLTVENGLADKINLGERQLFFTTAYAHLKAGCPMLALEVLSKMPKVIKRSKAFCKSHSLMDNSKDFSPSSPVNELETKDQSSNIDWSQPVLNGLGSPSDCSSGKHSTLSFDWSQPSVVFQDEDLKLQSDNDESDESGNSSLMMKELKPQKKTEKLCETSSSYTESFSVVDDNDILSPSEDIISAQLKFRACLKILTVELRTLSTGYGVDGGKLRYQLYHWLEREVVALQKTCDYSVEEIQSGVSVIPEETTLLENTEDIADQQKNFQKRRQWLLKYQSLLRMFLSYCILHGSHGGGLASVRMELILLLQESQQVCGELILRWFFFTLNVFYVFVATVACTCFLINVPLFLTGYVFCELQRFCCLEYPSPLPKCFLFSAGSCTISLCFLLAFRSSHYSYLPVPYQSKASYLSYLLAQLVPKQWWLIRCCILVT